MLKTIEYRELQGNYVLIDVRSPSEFKEATIPGAINIPLFSDEDRKNIGYVYVNESVDKAKQMGIEAVSRRLPEIYEEIAALYKNHGRLVFFCARGGMRSCSITALCNSLSIKAFRIKGGYKGYRDFINQELPKVNQDIKYIVFHGKTGIGKTEILKCLKARGCDVLDLEEAANHRGSLLGSVGLGEQTSQKQFESLVYEELKKRKSNYVFVEGESRRIGNIIISQCIFDSMRNGIHILGEAEISYRAKILVNEYTKMENCKEEILLALDKMSRYMSEDNITRFRQLVAEEQYEEVATELMIKYYDPMYSNEFKKYNYDLVFKINSVEECCDFLITWLKEQIGV